MEVVVGEESPLAAYLEGRGEAEDAHEQSIEHSRLAARPAEPFAPRGLPILHLGSHKFVLHPILQTRWIAILKGAYVSAFNFVLGTQENEHFLEHFRYTIIASQLLNENSNPASNVPSQASSKSLENALESASSSIVSGSSTGAALSAASAFGLVWLIHWSREGLFGSFNASTFLLVAIVIGLGIASLYLFVRREWLQRLRRQAISTASALVTNIQSFEASTLSILTLIQEVELVSRGYRLSSPLPPVSRLESGCHQRKCSRLRRNLDSTLSKSIPAFITSIELLRDLVDDEDLERYYEVYDVRAEDLQDAFSGYSTAELDENETVRQLRMHQYRFCTLRRILLCSLLALPASSKATDLTRWHTVVTEMDQLRLLIGELGQNLARLINEDENINSEIPPQSPIRSRNSLGHRRVQLQIRKISALSGGIRSLQAKIYLLRDESNRTLSSSDSETDISELGASLMDQYESIGSDLKMLMQAWESGKAALAQSIDWHERRISRCSSGLRSPTSSLGGLTAVEEDAGGPAQALKMLTGDLPLSPPSTEYGEVSPSEDDEVFEAIALPRQRSALTREQRILKVQEERERQANLKEKRESSTILIRELESVIKLRPNRILNGRTTSV